MPLITLVYGDLLLVIGLAFYFGSGRASWTALLPAGFGIVFQILWFLARNRSLRQHVMHTAAALGMVVFLGSVRGLLQLPRYLAGEPVARPLAVIEQSLVAVLSVVFVGLCIKSFLDARRRRAAGQ